VTEPAGLAASVAGPAIRTKGSSSSKARSLEVFAASKLAGMRAFGASDRFDFYPRFFFKCAEPPERHASLTLSIAG